MKTTPKYSAEARLRDTLLSAGILNPDSLIDAFRDEVPGRTITESEYASAVEASRLMIGVSPRSLASNLGITVVPDPEPTNVGELADALQAYAGIDLRAAKAVAEDLSREGWTKAPGGDDE